MATAAGALVSRAKAPAVRADRDRDAGAAGLPVLGPAGPNAAHAVHVRPPPILSGDRTAQRQFHQLYQDAPWLTASDALFVGNLIYLEQMVADLAKDLANGRPLYVRSESGREFLSGAVRLMFEAMREVRYTAQMLALPVKDRTSMGLTAAATASMIERIRDLRAEQAAARTIDAEAS